MSRVIFLNFLLLFSIAVFTLATVCLFTCADFEQPFRPSALGISVATPESPGALIAVPYPAWHDHRVGSPEPVARTTVGIHYADPDQPPAAQQAESVSVGTHQRKGRVEGFKIVPSTTDIHDLPTESAEKKRGGLDNKDKIALGLGLGIGLPSMLSTVAMCYISLWRGRTTEPEQARPSEGSTPHGRHHAAP